MRLVISMFEEEFIKAIKHDDVKEVVEFYLGQEFEKVMTIDEFLKTVNFEGFADIYDSIEFDVENDLGRLLNKYGIWYSRYVVVEEDNELDDINSINEAKYLYSDLNIYSEYQSMWV